MQVDEDIRSVTENFPAAGPSTAYSDSAPASILMRSTKPYSFIDSFSLFSPALFLIILNYAIAASR